MNVSNQQIIGAASAGVRFINLESTLIPGNIRKQVSVLEMILTGVATGNLVVVSPDQLQVQSQSDDEGKSNDEGLNDGEG